MTLLEQFKTMLKKQKAYGYVLTLAGWDSNTEAPREAFKRRAEMLGVISGELFELRTSKEYQDVVYGLYEKLDELEDSVKREVKKAKKDLDKILKIPQKEYIEYNKLINLSQKVWEDAKEQSDFSIFQENLEKIIAFNRKFVDYYEIDDHPYNVLLDEYEEGLNMDIYDEFFATLKRDLVPFVKEVLKQKPKQNDSFITASFDPKKQKEFCEYLMDVFHFDQNRGLMKESVHPFTWNTSPEDVRFTTRYLENYLFSSIFAAIHEIGHATYEQQIDTKWDDTYLNGGTSMGIHESQSRFYENTIGRSKEFWQVHYPKLKELFPKQLNNVSLDDFHKAINKVSASYIRVEADELTYPLHIMIRYEIERMLFSKDIEVKDLPRVWNEKMVEYLGIEPSNDAEGVLQDVHWSAGLIGYFPTYALGTAYAAQFYYAMKDDINLEQTILDDKIEDINAYFKKNIHKYGSSKSPKELLQEVTNESFNPKYYVRYLIQKYSDLYL